MRLYDTVGLEIDAQVTKKTLEDVKALILRAQQEQKEHSACLVWFCVNSNRNRFEPYEVELIKQLSLEHEIPFVIVVTQCFTPEHGELEQMIEKELTEIPIRRVLARGYRFRNGLSVEPFGVEELLAHSASDYNKNKVHVLEQKLQFLQQDRKRIAQSMRERGARCVAAYSRKAEKVAWVPVGCIPFVHGLCVKMLTELDHIAGISSAKGFISELLSDEALGLIATPVMAIPLLSVAAATSYIETVGENYLNVLLAVVEDTPTGEMRNNRSMEERIRAELKKRKKQEDHT